MPAERESAVAAPAKRGLTVVASVERGATEDGLCLSGTHGRHFLLHLFSNAM